MCLYVCVCVVFILFVVWWASCICGFLQIWKNFGHYFFALFEFSYSPLSYRDVNYMYVELLETSHVSVKLCSLFFQSLFLYASVWMECEVKWTLESITMNKASGGDGIPVELFQILKDDAVKVLHSICQQIWKTQHWPQDWKRSVFIPISKKDNAKVPHNCTHLTRARFNTKVLFTLMP